MLDDDTPGRGVGSIVRQWEVLIVPTPGCGVVLGARGKPSLGARPTVARGSPPHGPLT